MGPTDNSKSKRKVFNKNEFSDNQAYEEIRDDIKEIRDRNLKQVHEEKEIMKLYQLKKQELKRRRMGERQQKYTQEKSKRNQALGASHLQHDLGENDQEEGQISENKEQLKNEKMEEDLEQVPSIRNLGDHIRPITLTRNRVAQMIMSRKFEDIIKGCFVRYKAESSSGNTNSYLLAQIIGVVEGSKQYTLNKSTRTKKLLKLQQSSQQIITLSIELLSNQHPPGALEISAWIRANRNTIPKERELEHKLKQKFQELNKLMYGKISSEEIDQTIYQEAMEVSKRKSAKKEDIEKSIYFIEVQLHDITVSIDELESKHSDNQKSEFEKANDKKKKYEEILEILKQKKQQVEEEKANERKLEEQKNKKKNKKYSEMFFQDRQHDQIKIKAKDRVIMLSSYESSNKVLKEIQKAHQTYNFDIQI